MLLMISCVTGLVEQEKPQADCTEDKYPITVEMDLPQVAAGARSSYSDELMNRITDLNIFIYHDGRLLEEHSSYCEDMSSLMLSFPYGKNGFNIYMIGNVGRMDPPEDESEIVNLCYVAEGYDEFRENGFPVANVFPDYLKGTFASFRLKRLVGQYDISLRSSAVDAKYFIKDVRLKNCALDVYPFGYGRKASKFVAGGDYGEEPGGDYLTEDDIARLNRGEKVSICFMENLQGELLPGNMDRTQKIPSSLEALQKGLSDNCTYMEITADIVTPSAQYTDAKYRFYLGQNETTDFSVVRNTLYEVALDFTQNMVSEQEWRIEASAPQVNALVASKEVADVAFGIDDYILLSGPKMKINQQLSDDSDPLCCSYSLTDVYVNGEEYQKLTFHTEKKPVGFYSWGMDYRTLASKCKVYLESVETYNGEPLLSKIFNAYVYDNVFPVFLRIGTNDSGAPYQLEALSDAPVNFQFSMSASLSAENASASGISTYKSADSVMGVSAEGLKCCIANFPGLYNSIGSSSEKTLYFRRLDVKITGKESEYSGPMGFYMGDGGQAYWGPGSSLAPQRFSDLETDASVSAVFLHSCSVPGCVRYEIVSEGVPLFRMAPDGLTCSTLYSTGTSNSLSYDMAEYSTGEYLPFYIVNGGLKYSVPVTLQNDDAKYLDDSGRKSIIFQMYGPGRDVFYPNGAVWGGPAEMAPSGVHKFGYTAGLVKQFFGNIHTWQIYQDYECQFFMTINGCTTWPGASNLDTGFRLTYKL
jgi:hypothetical protein